MSFLSYSANAINTFRRIFDSLYMHSFKTSQGYIPVVVGVSISAADASTGHPRAKEFLEFAYQGLSKSFETGIITMRPFDPTVRLEAEHG